MHNHNSSPLINHTDFPSSYLLDLTSLGIEQTKANNLTYHNEGHLNYMFESIKSTWFASSLVPIEYTLCTAWHDCVYIPGAPDGYNEKLSSICFKKKASLLRKIEGSSEQDLPQIELASRGIDRTAVRYHLGEIGKLDHENSEEYQFFARMLDADLSSMGSSPEYFEINQARILAEHEVALYEVMQGQTDNYIKSLTSFYASLKTGRDTLYRTPEALAKYELKAQKNIANILDRAKHEPKELCQELVKICNSFGVSTVITPSKQGLNPR